VILLRESDDTNRLAGFAEGFSHTVRLLVGYDAIAAAVHDEDGSRDSRDGSDG